MAVGIRFMRLVSLVRDKIDASGLAASSRHFGQPDIPRPVISRRTCYQESFFGNAEMNRWGSRRGVSIIYIDVDEAARPRVVRQLSLRDNSTRI